MRSVVNAAKYRNAAANHDARRRIAEYGIDQPNGCREWSRARNVRGYGIISALSNSMMAHRLSYWIAYGPVPDDLVVDHMCQNRACILPAHLRLLTRAENLQIQAPAFKSHCKNGHPLSGDNLHVYVDPRGRAHRTCRTCANEKSVRFRAKAKAA